MSFTVLHLKTEPVTVCGPFFADNNTCAGNHAAACPRWIGCIGPSIGRKHQFGAKCPSRRYDGTNVVPRELTLVTAVDARE